MRTLTLLVSVLVVLTSASTAFGQLAAARNGPIVYGHHHLNTTNIEAHKKFFVETLGGRLIKIGTNNAEVVEFPNVLIFFRTTQAPTGGTRGTTVNHIGFSVPNLRQAVDKIKANGFPMITKTEASADREVKDDIAGPAQPGGASIAFALAPDDQVVGGQRADRLARGPLRYAETECQLAFARYRFARAPLAGQDARPQPLREAVAQRPARPGHGATTTFSASPARIRGKASGVSSRPMMSETTERIPPASAASMSSAATWSRWREA